MFTTKLIMLLYKWRSDYIAKCEKDKTKASGISWILLYPLYWLLVSTLLTLCDYYCHARLDVLYYHHPEKGYSLFPKHPTSEVFAGFFGITLFCFFTGLIFFGRKFQVVYADHAVFSVFIFVLQYYCSGVFKNYPMLLFNAFLLTWGIHLTSAFTGSNCNKVVIFSIMLGILGPLVEGYYSGVVKFFAYNGILVYHVPIWLGVLYMNGGIAVAVTIAWLQSKKSTRAKAV